MTQFYWYIYSDLESLRKKNAGCYSCYISSVCHKIWRFIQSISISNVIFFQPGLHKYLKKATIVIWYFYLNPLLSKRENILSRFLRYQDMKVLKAVSKLVCHVVFAIRFHIEVLYSSCLKSTRKRGKKKQNKHWKHLPVSCYISVNFLLRNDPLLGSTYMYTYTKKCFNF